MESEKSLLTIRRVWHCRSVQQCGSPLGGDFDDSCQVTLINISAAGFGHRITWEDEAAPPGHRMSFKRAVETLETGLFIKLLYPKWLFEWAPTETIREARDGFAEFQVRCSELELSPVSSG